MFPRSVCLLSAGCTASYRRHSLSKILRVCAPRLEKPRYIRVVSMGRNTDHAELGRVSTCKGVGHSMICPAGAVDRAAQRHRSPKHSVYTSRMPSSGVLRRVALVRTVG
jgi:hypothetical protein